MALLTAPGGHGWHSDAKFPDDAYFPFGQTLHALPMSKELPASHTGKQLADPESEYVLSSHREQVLDPDEANLPPLHGLHAVPFAADARPAAHSSHTSEFAVADTLPDSHMRQPLKPS